MMTDTQKPTKQKRSRRDRREDILKAATLLFSEYGFRGTTIAQISEAVELTDPGVLHYFPSKVHLLQGVLEYRDEKDYQRYAAFIDLDVKEFSELFHILENLVAENAKIPSLIRLFTVLVSESIREDHPSHEFFVDRYRRARETYKGQFFDLLKDDIRPDVNIDELVSVIMAVMDGLQIQWLLDPEEVDMVASFKLFSQMVIPFLNGNPD